MSTINSMTREQIYSLASKRSVAMLKAWATKEWPEAIAVHGWRHDGPGVALYGWHLRFATGRCRYLGRSAADVLVKLYENTQ